MKAMASQKEKALTIVFKALCFSLLVLALRSAIRRILEGEARRQESVKEEE
jgi:hypothetical protein